MGWTYEGGYDIQVLVSPGEQDGKEERSGSNTRKVRHTEEGLDLLSVALEARCWITWKDRSNQTVTRGQGRVPEPQQAERREEHGFSDSVLSRRQGTEDNIFKQRR